MLVYALVFLVCRLAVVGRSAADVAMLIYALDPATGGEGLGTAQLNRCVHCLFYAHV